MNSGSSLAIAAPRGSRRAVRLNGRRTPRPAEDQQVADALDHLARRSGRRGRRCRASGRPRPRPVAALTRKARTSRPSIGRVREARPRRQRQDGHPLDQPHEEAERARPRPDDDRGAQRDRRGHRLEQRPLDGQRGCQVRRDRRVLRDGAAEVDDALDARRARRPRRSSPRERSSRAGEGPRRPPRSPSSGSGSRRRRCPRAPRPGRRR